MVASNTPPRARMARFIYFMHQASHLGLWLGNFRSIGGWSGSVTRALCDLSRLGNLTISRIPHRFINPRINYNEKQVLGLNLSTNRFTPITGWTYFGYRNFCHCCCCCQWYACKTKLLNSPYITLYSPRDSKNTSALRFSLFLWKMRELNYEAGS